MTVLRIPTARVFQPLLAPARYKGAYGGRGSGKSHFFAEALVEECQAEKGTLGVCIREVQRTLAQSSKRLVEGKIQALGVGQGFTVYHDRIATPGDGLIVFTGMQDHTAESIKSMEGFKFAWIDEAQTFSARSLSLLRPTIRVDKSELWFSWNPTRKKDAVDLFFRGGVDDEGKPVAPAAGSLCVQANWRDNPWWNDILEAERQLEIQMFPERYDHTYEGGYAQAFEGAYFAKLLTEAKLTGRIGSYNAEPLLTVRAYADIGGSGASADAFVFWIVQFVEDNIVVLDHYETVGQTLAYHVRWLRKRGYQDAEIILPHDGVNENSITGKTYQAHFEDAGFSARVIENQGKGAAAMRIEAVRRLAPKYRFNERTTEAGRQALGYYHEKKDEKRNIGLGPNHDWASHSADAFGLMAVDYRAPANSANFNRTINYPVSGNA